MLKLEDMATLYKWYKQAGYVANGTMPATRLWTNLESIVSEYLFTKANAY